MKLILRDIEKHFGDKNVLKRASFTFEKGKIYGLLGRNGCGKTTLFNCISKELEMDGGSALIEHNGMLRKVEEKDIGFAYATPILPEFLTGYEFVKFYMDLHKRVDDPNSIEDYFSLMQIKKEDRHRLIKGYSHGMKNKLQMLCFFISKPDIILLDEPLTSFDVVVALEMKQLLKDMKEDHILILSTHILELAKDLCDEIVILNNGTLEAMSYEMMNSPAFEENVVELLKEDAYDTV